VFRIQHQLALRTSVTVVTLLVIKYAISAVRWQALLKVGEDHNALGVTSCKVSGDESTCPYRLVEPVVNILFISLNLQMSCVVFARPEMSPGRRTRERTCQTKVRVYRSLRMYPRWLHGTWLAGWFPRCSHHLPVPFSGITNAHFILCTCCIRTNLTNYLRQGGYVYNYNSMFLSIRRITRKVW